MDLESLKSIIWDWNGTLLDDGDLSFDLNAKIFSKYGCKLNSNELRERFIFPVSKYIDSLNLEMSEKDILEASRAFKKQYLQALPDIKLAPGTMKTLQYFKDAGMKQYILSSAPRDVLLPALEKYNVSQFISGVSCNEPGFGGSLKQALADKLLAEHLQIEVGRSLYFGDTDHDGHVADHLKCKCVLVSWGHQTPNVVHGTSYKVIDNFSELDGLFSRK